MSVPEFETIKLSDITSDVLPNENFNIPGIFPPLAEFTEAEFLEFAKTHATFIDATASSTNGIGRPTYLL